MTLDAAVLLLIDWTSREENSCFGL